MAVIRSANILFWSADRNARALSREAVAPVAGSGDFWRRSWLTRNFRLIFRRFVCFVQCRWDSAKPINGSAKGENDGNDFKEGWRCFRSGACARRGDDDGAARCARRLFDFADAGGCKQRPFWIEDGTGQRRAMSRWRTFDGGIVLWLRNYDSVGGIGVLTAYGDGISTHSLINRLPAYLDVCSTGSGLRCLFDCSWTAAIVSNTSR